MLLNKMEKKNSGFKLGWIEGRSSPFCWRFTISRIERSKTLQEGLQYRLISDLKQKADNLIIYVGTKNNPCKTEDFINKELMIVTGILDKLHPNWRNVVILSPIIRIDQKEAINIFKMFSDILKQEGRNIIFHKGISVSHLHCNCLYLDLNSTTMLGQNLLSSISLSSLSLLSLSPLSLLSLSSLSLLSLSLRNRLDLLKPILMQDIDIFLIFQTTLDGSFSFSLKALARHLGDTEIKMAEALSLASKLNSYTFINDAVAFFLYCNNSYKGNNS